MKLLITGGSGFVGGRLIRRLAGQGLVVRATHRKEPLAPLAGVEWWPLNGLDDEDRLAGAVAGCDAVVHLAGLAHQSGSTEGRAEEFHRINTEGTRLVAQAAARGGVGKFVFASSIAAVCTQSDIAVDDRTPCAPTDAYGRSKREAEQALVAELEDSATDWCILRPPLLYGPGNPGNMRRLVQIMRTGLPLPFAGIRNRRSFMFVDNLVDAIVRVLEHPGTVRAAYVLSDGSDFSTPELVRRLAAASGRPARLVAIPVSALRIIGRAGDAMHAMTGKSLGIDSTAIDRLVGSLPVDGSGFRRFFEWHPPIELNHAFQQMGRALLP